MNGTECPKCGAVHEEWLTDSNGHRMQRCQGHSKQSDPLRQCQQRAMRGMDKCRYHGGKSPQALAARDRREAEDAANRAIATYGLPRDIDPHDALLEEIARTAGHVDWLANVIAQLDRDAIAFGVHSVETGRGEKGDIDKTTLQAGVAVWVDLYQRERKHLVDVCKAAIGAGIAERQVRLAEQQGQLIAEVLRQVIGDPELGLDPGRQEVARRVAARHLRALPA